MSIFSVFCSKNDQLVGLHKFTVSPPCPHLVPTKSRVGGDSWKTSSSAGLRVSVPTVPLKYLLPFCEINKGRGTVRKDSMCIGLGEKDSKRSGTGGDSAYPNRRKAAQLLAYRLSHYSTHFSGTLSLFNHYFWYISTTNLLARFCRLKNVQFNTTNTMYLVCNKTGGKSRG